MDFRKGHPTDQHLLLTAYNLNLVYCITRSDSGIFWDIFRLYYISVFILFTDLIGPLVRLAPCLITVRTALLVMLDVL